MIPYNIECHFTLWEPAQLAHNIQCTNLFSLNNGFYQQALYGVMGLEMECVVRVIETVENVYPIHPTHKGQDYFVVRTL